MPTKDARTPRREDSAGVRTRRAEEILRAIAERGSYRRWEYQHNKEEK